MITTASSAHAARLRLLRSQGMSIPPEARHATTRVVIEEYPVFGWTYRMSDVQAAIGRAQLARLPALVAKRRALAARYGERLADVPWVEPPAEPAWARSNWQSYCVRLADAVDQRRVLAHLLAAGIAAKPGIMCAHREAAFPRTVWRCGHDLACDAGAPCPHLRASERRRDHGLILPLFHDMTDADQRRVVAALRAACEAGT